LLKWNNYKIFDNGHSLYTDINLNLGNRYRYPVAKWIKFTDNDLIVKYYRWFEKP